MYKRQIQTPLLLGPGRLLRDAQGRLWWRGAAQHALPVAPLGDDALWRSLEWRSAVALWNGCQATVLRIDTAMGAAWPDA